MTRSTSDLVAALCRKLGPSGAARVIETHISYVILTGEYAYKIKKPVNLGFVDFTTLGRRRHCCEEELRLNRRLAPAIYVDVVAITGSADTPVVGGSGAPIEYAVRMREFPQEALASEALQRGEIGPALIDDLAAQVAQFHGRAQCAPPDGADASVATVLALALRNFERVPEAAFPAERLRALAEWTRAEHERLAPAMRERVRRGRVRECHGDLHLGNVAVIDGRPVVFDCIEFNDELRWIDVMSEVAFLAMDLRLRGRTDLASRFLNGYLEATGDYGGVQVLPFYLCYRAMVRAMVACERAAQVGLDSAGAAALAQARAYLELAERCARGDGAAIVVTHGFSGSGKTTGSQALLESLPAVRVRTDVERKRLYGLHPGDRPAAGDDTLYAAEATHRTYRHVLDQVYVAAAAGFVAIADGTFLRRWQREMFREAAAALGVPFVILSFRARAASMRARIVARTRAARDASDADLDILDLQLVAYDPLGIDEVPCAVVVDTESADPVAGPWPSVAAEIARRSRVAAQHTAASAA